MLLMTACGGSRGSVVPAAGEAATVQRYIPAGNSGLNSLVSSYSSDWQDFQAPVDISLKSPKSMSVSGRMTVVNNVGMTLSIRAIGFEVASLTVIGDSIFAYEKLNKRCVAESAKSLAADLGISSREVVNLLMGQLFLLSDGQVTSGDDSMLYLVPARQPSATVSYGWTVRTGDAGTTPASFVVEVGNRGGVIDYSAFEQTPAGPAASLLDMKVTTGKMNIAATLEVNYRKAKWNSGATITRPSFKGYRQVSGSTLLQMFNKLL